MFCFVWFCSELFCFVLYCFVFVLLLCLVCLSVVLFRVVLRRVGLVWCALILCAQIWCGVIHSARKLLGLFVSQLASPIVGISSPSLFPSPTLSPILSPSLSPGFEFFYSSTKLSIWFLLLSPISHFVSRSVFTFSKTLPLLTISSSLSPTLFLLCPCFVSGLFANMFHIVSETFSPGISNSHCCWYVKTVLSGLVWCSMLWGGAAWCGVVWCGVVPWCVLSSFVLFDHASFRSFLG